MRIFHAARTRVLAPMTPSAAFITRSSEIHRMTVGVRTIFLPRLLILLVRPITRCS